MNIPIGSALGVEDFPEKSVIKVGDTYKIRLFRAEWVEKILSEQWLMSTMLRKLVEEKVDFDRAVQETETASVDQLKALGHVCRSKNTRQNVSPFISASPYVSMAEQFAKQPGVRIMELAVPISRILSADFPKMEEVLIPVQIFPDEVIGMKKVAPRISNFKRLDLLGLPSLPFYLYEEGFVAGWNGHTVAKP